MIYRYFFDLETLNTLKIPESLWLQVHANRIEETMSKLLGNLTVAAQEMHKPKDYLELLDPSRFILSEMPLCTCLTALGIPEGYERITSYYGRVTLLPWGVDYDQGGMDHEAHEFPWNRSKDKVICLTAGQFGLHKAFKDSIHPGQRMEILKEIAPHLIVPVTKQVVAVCATRAELADKFAFDYHFA